MEVRSSEVVASKELGLHKSQVLLDSEVELLVIVCPCFNSSLVDRWAEKLSSVALRIEVGN